MVGTMGRYVTVSTKARRELVEEARRLGINISEVLRRALEEEVRRRRLEYLEKKLEAISNVLEKLDVDEIVRLVREDRESR
jgi:post-segregation antitoxin (ccd killing protein)